MWRLIFILLVGSFLSGCAGLQFNPSRDPHAFTYNEPVPYMLVSTTKDCATTATIMSIPGRERSVAFKSGYGSADLSVSVQNGMITSINQKTDTKVPETLTAAANLATSLGVKALLANGKEVICKPIANLYAIRNGRPYGKPIPFPVKTEVVDIGGTTK